MVVSAHAPIIRAFLVGLIVIFINSPFQPSFSFAESEIAVSAGETFTLPESGVFWTRNSNPAGQELTWAGALAFLNGLNIKKFAGCEGWRMPSREELTEMLEYLNSGSADDEDISPEQDDYWSSSVDPLEIGFADVVNMEDGSVDSNEKTETNYVWPVCGQ